jgi:hypothetical protein
MLMCLFSIRGHKGLGFCQVRTEVIPIYILKHKAHVLRRRSLKEKVATKCLINTLIEGTNREEKRYIIK